MFFIKKNHAYLRQFIVKKIKEVWYRRRCNSFFFLRFLFIWDNFSFYILMIPWWLKTKVPLCHQLLLKPQRFRRNRNILNRVSVKLFSFSSFSNFWKFRNRFWDQLKKMFLKIYRCFWRYAIFSLKFWYTMK